MIPVIPTVIGQGWEKHEFKFKVSVLPHSNCWQLSGGEPHPRNQDLIARWCVKAEFLVGVQNAFLLSLSSRVFCPERVNVFATVYIHFKDFAAGKTLHGFRKKWCYRVEREERFIFSHVRWIPPSTTMLVTFVSETGPKPGFTDIMLLDVEMKMVRLPPCEDESSSRMTRDGIGGRSRDIPDSTGNDESRLWIGNWEKFTFIFHSFKPKNSSGIEPSEVFVDDTMQRWHVELKSESDIGDTFHFLVTIKLLSSIERIVYAKVMYVVERKGRMTQKHEYSYSMNAGKTTTHLLKNTWDIKNTKVKVLIVSDTGSHSRQVYFPDAICIGRETKTQGLDQSFVKKEPEHPDMQEEMTKRKRFHPPATPDPSKNDQSVPTVTMNDPTQVDKDQPVKSKYDSEWQIAPSNLIDVAGPSLRNYDQISESHSSNTVKELSESKVSSSNRQDKQCKKKKHSNISLSQEIDTRLDLQYLEKWKMKDHSYSIPVLERFLYLYSIRIVEKFSSVQQHLCHKSEPQEASSSWNVKIESSLCSDSEVNIHIAAILEKSKINMLFARLLVFVYPRMDHTKYLFEKKQCLCIGESISEDLRNISISTTMTLVEILILSENLDRVVNHSCEHNVDTIISFVQPPIQRVFIQSSTDVLEADSDSLSNCSFILSGIIHNFDSENEDSRVIRMTDFSSKVVQNMLDFINGASKVDWKRKRTEQIFMLADKYCITELKEKCESHLMSLLKVTNALELLIFATDHTAEKLKILALEFVNSNNEYFRKNNRYNILHDRPEIMQQILEHLGGDRTLTEKRKMEDDLSIKMKKKNKRDR